MPGNRNGDATNEVRLGDSEFETRAKLEHFRPGKCVESAIAKRLETNELDPPTACQTENVSVEPRKTVTRIRKKKQADLTLPNQLQD